MLSRDDRFRLPHFVAFLVLAVAGLPSKSMGTASSLCAEEPAKTVSLVIDYGDGVLKQFTALAWREGMTALDAMRAAEKHPRGIRCEVRGSGATALVLAIDDMKNEGGAGRGWLYRVNGKLADRGVGVYVLTPGDAVLWKFEKYR